MHKYLDLLLAIDMNYQQKGKPFRLDIYQQLLIPPQNLVSLVLAAIAMLLGSKLIHASKI
jgi:hypothetical protein